MSDYYHLLNIPPTATPIEIREAYHRACALLAIEDTTENIDQRENLDQAYHVLSDTGLRAAYDRTLNLGQDSSAMIVVQPSANVVASQKPPIPVISQACPYCNTLNPVHASICNQCGQQISRPCPNCGNSNPVGQKFCLRCEAIIPEYDQWRFLEGTAIEQKIQHERREAEASVQVLEHTNRRNAIFGIAFWIIIPLVCTGLFILAIFAYTYFLSS